MSDASPTAVAPHASVPVATYSTSISNASSSGGGGGSMELQQQHLQVQNGNGHSNGHHPSASSSSSSSSSSSPTLVNKPSFIDDPRFRFLITDAPNDANLPAYIDAMKKRNVVVVARISEPTYNIAPLTAAGIKLVDIPFPDGDPPPQAVVDRWLALVDCVFKNGGKDGGGCGVELKLDGNEKPSIAVHCVAGLGRAPVLVAIALVEYGMEPFDAIALIRKKRRGAINARQLKYIEQYQPKNRSGGCCNIQ